MRRMYARFCRNDDIDIQLDFIDKIKDTDDMISSRRVRFPRRLFFREAFVVEAEQPQA